MVSQGLVSIFPFSAFRCASTVLVACCPQTAFADEICCGSPPAATFPSISSKQRLARSQQSQLALRPCFLWGLVSGARYTTASRQKTTTPPQHTSQSRCNDYNVIVQSSLMSVDQWQYQFVIVLPLPSGQYIRRRLLCECSVIVRIYLRSSCIVAQQSFIFD